MTKKILFQLHWLIGITAGIVIAIVGFTGAALSFQDEILHTLNGGVVTVPVQAMPSLLPPELLDKVQSENPGKRVLSVNVFAAPNRAARVTFANQDAAGGAGKAPQGSRRRGEVRYVDPYSGKLLGGKSIAGQEFLRTVEQVHRGMVAGPTGRAIVGVSTIALVLLVCSGLYVRWPRGNALQWRTWFKIYASLKGRPFLWNLHSVIGTVVLPFYLLASLTGLYMAYDWYRQGVIALVGASPPTRDVPKLQQPSEGPTDVALVWSAFERASGGYESATMTLPPSRDNAVEIRYFTRDSAHERATDRMVIHPVTGEVISLERFADKSAGNRFVGGMFPLHSGGYFGVAGRVLVMAASLAMPLFAITGWMMYLKRRSGKPLTDKVAVRTISETAAESR